MKHLIKLSVVAVAVALLSFLVMSDVSFAQNVGKQNGKAAGFADADGDAIPNGLDPDYRPLNPNRGHRFGFVDQDGDGINDQFQDADGDGIPNCQDADYVRPQDGTGNKFGHKVGKGNGQEGQNMKGAGPKAGSGSGICDGTGPKGSARTKRAGR